MGIQDNAIGTSDDLADDVKTWLAAGIPAVIPGSQFRKLLPMGATFFGEEVSSGRLRAVKNAGKVSIPIEEAVRYKNSLESIRGDEAEHHAPQPAAA